MARPAAPWQTMLATAVTTFQLAVQFLLQVAVILAICQIVGAIGQRFGQPQVVGEMIAGVVIGPSVFGLFFPELAAQLFPPDSMKVLFPLSQLGLAAYMFVVGLEFRMDIVSQRLRSAVAVSIAGMAAPFALGALLGWFFHAHTTLFRERTSLPEAMIFLGASMCITAFPMLARIISFKKLAGTTMGTVALGAGAINDAAAWCLLAIVLASFDGDFTGAVRTIGSGVAYIAFAFLILRPILARWGRGIEARGTLSDREFVIALILMAAGAWFTDMVGLHAVFGAFVMGAVLPRGVVAEGIIARAQPLTVALLLPLFFTYSGLNTQIALLDSAHLWFMAFLVLLAAVAGKGVACWLAARATGIAESRGSRHRHAHERARPDGVDHHQHRPPARHHLARSLRRARYHGGHHHADGVAHFRSPDAPRAGNGGPGDRSDRTVISFPAFFAPASFRSFTGSSSATGTRNSRRRTRSRCLLIGDDRLHKLHVLAEKFLTRRAVGEDQDARGGNRRCTSWSNAAVLSASGLPAMTICFGFPRIQPSATSIFGIEEGARSNLLRKRAQRFPPRAHVPSCRPADNPGAGG